LRRARDYIVEKGLNKISFDELTQVTGLSRFHLIRSFAREFGMPPHAFQIQVRLERARSLLAAGMSISQVECEVGFADQSHLTRHFRAIFGVTPGQYAASIRRVSNVSPHWTDRADLKVQV
jgi:AraC-like DNA-binding protein